MRVGIVGAGATGLTAAFTIFGDFSPSADVFDPLDGTPNPVTGFAQQFGGFTRGQHPLAHGEAVGTPLRLRDGQREVGLAGPGRADDHQWAHSRHGVQTPTK